MFQNKFYKKPVFQIKFDKKPVFQIKFYKKPVFQIKFYKKASTEGKTFIKQPVYRRPLCTPAILLFLLLRYSTDILYIKKVVDSMQRRMFTF